MTYIVLVISYPSVASQVRNLYVRRKVNGPDMRRGRRHAQRRYFRRRSLSVRDKFRRPISSGNSHDRRASESARRLRAINWQ